MVKYDFKQVLPCVRNSDLPELLKILKSDSDSIHRNSKRRYRSDLEDLISDFNN